MLQATAATPAWTPPCGRAAPAADKTPRTAAVCRIGAEALKFGGTFAAGCNARGVTEDEIARHEAKPDVSRLPPSPEAREPT